MIIEMKLGVPKVLKSYRNYRKIGNLGVYPAYPIK